MTYLYAFLFSFIAALLFTPLTIKMKRERKGISCFGGVGIYIAFLVAVGISFFLKELDSSKLTGFFLSSGFILLLGIIDDVKELRPSIKIIGELLGIGILLVFGIVTKIVFLPVGVNILITVLWLLFITNAFNLLDIVDGLASGLIVIISLTFLCISLVNQDIFSSIILIALIGAHLGFLRYNYPPAKVYMGDAGSLVSGFLLAVVAINISYAPLERPVALLTPILAMALPIYDTFFLILMRLKKRRPIFRKSRDHFVLRLVSMGYSVHKGIWIMYLFSLFLALSSIVIAFSPNLVGLVMLILVVLSFIFMGKKVAMVEIE